jgi:hypothetical protein
MLLSIIKFELRYRLKQFQPYLFFVILGIITFLAILSMAGGLGSGVVSVGTSSGGKVFANSPYNLFLIIAVIGSLATSIVAAIMGNAIYRDFESNINELFFSRPISKFQYLAGRFIGSFIVCVFAASGLVFGAWLATCMPWAMADKLGENQLLFYLHPYFFSVIPNMLFTGSLFFMLGALTRNMMITNVGGILLMVLYMISSNFLDDIDNKTLAALFDPLGLGAVAIETEYWTSAEKNTLLNPITGTFLFNRMLWMGMGLFLLFFTYKGFSFNRQLSGKKEKKVQKQTSENLYKHLLLPQAKQNFNIALLLSQYITLSKLELASILKNASFIAILLCGLIVMFLNGSQAGELYGTTTYPVTGLMIELIVGSFMIFFLIMIAVYSGEAVWRERTVKINQIYDALPMPNGIAYLSKLTALAIVNLLVLSTLILGGIILQTFMGYTHYEIGVYLKSILGLQFIDLCMLTVFGLFIHTLVNNRYVGNFIIILYYLLTTFYSVIGINDNLIKVFSDPGFVYSDMNGFGHFMKSYMWFKIYWGAFALILAIVTNLFWVRGTDIIFKLRILATKARFKMSYIIVSLLAITVFIGTGGFVYYNTHVMNSYLNKDDLKERSVDYERKYLAYKNLVPPSLSKVKLEVDIFPNERSFDARGICHYINKSKKNIDTLLLNYQTDFVIRELSVNKETELFSNDSLHGVKLMKLKNALLPGDSLTLTYDFTYSIKGFKNEEDFNQLTFNGTFFNSGIFPMFGFVEDAILKDDDDRKQYGLALIERKASIYDTTAYQKNYVTKYDGWMDYECTISTSDDQIAIAPGYLQKDWTEKGRRYFHYKMEPKMLGFYSFISARYEVKRDLWKSNDSAQHDVAIEIYYHKGHEYNVDKMIKGIKNSLDYFTSNFSPYQFKQVRIVEFPRYESFAQSFPNTIPYSESIGFIARLDSSDEENLDYPNYITAHEIAHQWWAHQVLGADVQGCTMLSESMAQYSALMVMKDEFGKEKMRRFLKYELNKYLKGRSKEEKKEMPLYLNENQQYIHYQKGSMVFYALQDYIGEDSLNIALKRYIKKVAYHEDPYTTSLEMLSYINAVTPDSLKYILDDMFKTITLYENKVENVSYKKLNDGKYEVTLNFDSKKLRADSLGNETEIAFNDWIDVGVFTEKDAKGKELYFKKHKISAQIKELKIIVDEVPASAGIDPYNKLIDRHPDDNVKAVEMKYPL